MKTKLIIATVILVTAFISCDKKSKHTETDLQMLTAKVPDAEKIKDFEKQQLTVNEFYQMTSDTTLAAPVKNTVSVKGNIDWDKKIIKTATLRLEIKDFKKYNDYVHAAVKHYGAYIAQEEQNLSDEKSETAISIKVPVEQFETMMNRLPADDSKLLERKINTDDVTGQIIDTKSRLEAKKQMRQKYLEFLKQSKNMEEVLQVQHEINDIQEQIESAAGQITYLSHQSAYSTINLSFYQPMAGYKPTDNAPSFLTRISAAFKTGTSWIADLIVGLIAVWPLILILIGGYMSWKIIRPKKVIAQQA